LVSGFAACEKDDICDPDTLTTPRLTIEFYYTASDSLLNVTNLKIVGEGMSDGIVFSAATDSTRYLANTNKISLPLRVTDDSTTYYLTLNSTDPNLAQTDTLRFNYSRNTVFISRACGYKTLFNLNNIEGLPNAVILNNDPLTAQGNWIENFSVEKYNVENENETHLKIYFSN
jgi:hypothetical protein